MSLWVLQSESGNVSLLSAHKPAQPGAVQWLRLARRQGLGNLPPQSLVERPGASAPSILSFLGFGAYRRLFRETAFAVSAGRTGHAMTWLGRASRRPRIGPKRHIPMPAGNPTEAVVRLERGGCYGDWPDLQRRAARQRRCRLSRLVSRGCRRAPPVADRPRRGCRALLVFKFGRRISESLKRRYAAPITDNATYRLSVTVGGHTKTLEDYVGVAAGMPKAVSALEDGVDRLAGTDRWLLGDTSTLTSLQAEGWDFHGAQAAQTLARAAAKAPEEVALRFYSRR